MREDTLRSIDAFLEALRQDPRYLDLKAKEKAMVSDPLAKDLSSQKDRKNELYEEKCRFFGEDSNEAKKAYMDLYKTKCELDELPVVKEYQQAYNALHLTYVELDQLLFSPFRNKRRCHQ